MRTRSRTEAVLATALVTLGLAVPGCGGSSEEGAAGGEASARSAERAAEKGQSAGGGSGRERDSGDAAGEAPGGKGERGARGDSGESSVRAGVAEIPAEDRVRFANTAAASVLRSLGIPRARIEVSDDGYTVTVGVPREYACSVGASRIDQIVAALEDAILSARTVKLNVEYGGRLRDYVRTSCPRLELPSADGRVVYSQSGSGTKGSDEFRIESRRWTVAWENGGGELKIAAVRGNKSLDPVIESSKREVGSQAFKGPGTFRVVAYSSGRWQIRVFDGR